MTGTSACYRVEYGDLNCPCEMFGANAPGQTWHMTFDHANLTGLASTSRRSRPTSALWNAGQRPGRHQPADQKPKSATATATATATAPARRQRPGNGHWR